MSSSRHAERGDEPVRRDEPSVPAGRSSRASYRELPGISGWGYLAATYLGRLPTSMVPLAVITYATTTTGSLAIGGIAAAAAAFGEAAGAALTGRLADRHGQRRILLIGVAAHLVSLAAFALLAGVAPDAATIAIAAAVGLSLPQIGAFSRARWIAMTGDVRAAFAFEGALDEIVYIIGPALVGVVSLAWSPQAAVALSGALVAVFATWFALHPTHARVPKSPRRDTPQPEDSTAPDADALTPARRRALIAVAFLGMLGMGTFFGSSQAGLTAFAEQIGSPGAGALFYAVMAVGSAATTIAMVVVPEKIGPWARWAVAAAGMTGGAILLASASSAPAVIVTALIAGAFQGPLLFTVFSVAGSLAESGRASGLLGFIASGVVLGLGIGSAVAGPVAQHAGASAALLIAVCAAALQIVLAGTGRAVELSGRARPRP